MCSTSTILNQNRSRPDALKQITFYPPPEPSLASDCGQLRGIARLRVDASIGVPLKPTVYRGMAEKFLQLVVSRLDVYTVAERNSHKRAFFLTSSPLKFFDSWRGWIVLDCDLRSSLINLVQGFYHVQSGQALVVRVQWQPEIEAASFQNYGPFFGVPQNIRGRLIIRTPKRTTCFRELTK